MESRTEIEELVGRAVRKVSPEAEPSGADLSLRELGISSLLLFPFVEALEAEMGMAIPDAMLDPARFHGLADVYRLVEDVRAANAA